MRELALLGVHGVVSIVFTVGAVIIGPCSTEAQIEHVVLVTYTLLQIFAALLIAAAARRGSKVQSLLRRWRQQLGVFGAQSSRGWRLAAAGYDRFPPGLWHSQSAVL